jgi:hypothetical protein
LLHFTVRILGDIILTVPVVTTVANDGPKTNSFLPPQDTFCQYYLPTGPIANTTILDSIRIAFCNSRFEYLNLVTDPTKYYKITAYGTGSYGSVANLADAFWETHNGWQQHEHYFITCCNHSHKLQYEYQTGNPFSSTDFLMDVQNSSNKPIPVNYAYNPNHIYVYVRPGNGGKFGFRMWDASDVYADNSGYITLTIEEIPQQWVGVYRRSENTFYLRTSNAGGFATMAAQITGVSGQFSYPIIGDWDGDGYDTIGVFDSSNGLFQLRNSNSSGTADLQFPFGNPGDIPLSGHWKLFPTAPVDFNTARASRKQGIGVFRPSSGVLFLRYVAGPGATDEFYIYGSPGDQVSFAGDWNGDRFSGVGKSYISTVDFDNGVPLRYLRLYDRSFSYFPDQPNAPTPTSQIALAVRTQVPFYSFQSPVAGNWLGLAADSYASFDSTSGVWALTYKSGDDRTDTSFTYGNPSDIPIAGHWLGAAILQPAVPTMPPFFNPPQNYRITECSINQQVNIRNFPALDGRLVGTAGCTTPVSVYEQRIDNASNRNPALPSDYWYRVSPYQTTTPPAGATAIANAYWIRSHDANGNPLLVTSQAPPPIALTPGLVAPSPAPIVTQAANSECGVGNWCPFQGVANPPAIELIAFVIYCEDDNLGSESGAMDVAFVIANRMKSSRFNASSAVGVISQAGQFECYGSGARPTSPVANKYFTNYPSHIQSIANLLATQPLSIYWRQFTNPNGIQTVVNQDVAHIGLYFQGVLASQNPQLSRDVQRGLVQAGCQLQSYFGYSKVEANQNFVNAFFSDASNCTVR